MMFRKITLVSLLFATAALVTATWFTAFMVSHESIQFESLSIQPNGSPRLQPFEIKMGDSFQGDVLKLTHRLVFDGGRYFSDFELPITTSSIIQLDKDSYVWWDLEGRGYLLKTLPPLANEKWSISKIDGEKLLVSEIGGEERYIYVDGQLQEAYRHGVRQRFYYGGKRLKRITAGPPDNQASLEFIYDQNGRLSAIDSSIERINFVRSDEGMLTGIKGANGLAMAFTYSDELLTEANCDGKSLNWTWGVARMIHSRPRIPLQPTIRSDGANNYEVVYDGNLVKVRWTQIESGITKKWEYLPLTGRIRVRAF